VSQWAEIRQMHLVNEVPKKEIARRLGVNIKTVRRAVELEAFPKRRASPRRGRRLDACREEIVALLRLEPRVSAKRVGRLLGLKAPAVRERALRKYVQDLKRELFGTEAFVHRTHSPGDTLEATSSRAGRGSAA